MPPSGKLTIHQKILNATAFFDKQGIKPACRKKVAKMCGFPKETKSYGNALRLLRDKGCAQYDKDTIELTTEGYMKADPQAELGSNADVLNAAKEKVKATKAKLILDIVASDRRAHTRASIGEQINHDHTKKSFGNLLGPIKQLGFIEYVKDNNGEAAVRASDDSLPI